MGTIFKYLIAMPVLALAIPASVSAQDDTDNGQFNALDYSMQKRHRPADDAFVNSRFWDNTFVSASIGEMQLAPIPSTTFSWGPVAGISFGKWVNPYSGLRLSVAGNIFARNWDNPKPYNVGADISYLFNMTSYLNGYSRSRFCDIYTVAGLGYRASWLREDITHTGNIHLGLSFNLKTGKHIDLFIEPLVYLYSEGLAHTGDVNWRGYDIAYGGQAGLKFNFMPEEASRPRVDYTRNTFVSFAGGVQFQNTPYVRSTGEVLRSIGPAFAFSYGKWYTDIFALRTSLSWSTNVWNSYGKFLLHSRYASIRVEGMFDMISLFSREKKDDRPFSFYVILGPEAGVFKKVDVDRNIRYPYLAMDGAFQLKWKLVDSLSMFLEPRFSIYPYSYVPSNNYLDGVRHNFCDCLFSLNLGVEVALFR